MLEIGVRELKTSLSSVLHLRRRGRAGPGDESRGRPVADIVPAGSRRARRAPAPRWWPTAGSHRLRAPVPRRSPRPLDTGRSASAIILAERARRALMLYLDASALVKRYVEEEGSEAAAGRDGRRRAVGRCAGVGLCGDDSSRRPGRWTAGSVKRVERRLAVLRRDRGRPQPSPSTPRQLALSAGLRSLDALHLAAALVLRPSGI